MLSLGYDEDKTPSERTTADYRGAADFRGGQLVSTEVVTGDIATSLTWKCSDGHTFDGSPRLILLLAQLKVGSSPPAY